MDMFSAFQFERNSSLPLQMKLIDQRKLPNQTVWVSCDRLEDCVEAISNMTVRGAPAIGCTAALAFVVDVETKKNLSNWGQYAGEFATACEALAASRPTAVNLFYAIDKFKVLVEKYSESTPLSTVHDEFRQLAFAIFDDDLKTCQAIGDHGAGLVDHAEFAPSEGPAAKLNILTHCNTGSLATAGYGTALGVIRSLWRQGRLGHVFVDETRPYLQGSRLTTFELDQDGIPYSLICDNAAGHIMATEKIHWAVVGADRIAANGDTANKIGTYNVSVLCHYHKVKFLVAAPFSTFDMTISDGSGIPIEERCHSEVREVNGHPLSLKSAPVRNPSFDVTPHALIDGIVTEKGVIIKPDSARVAGFLSS